MTTNRTTTTGGAPDWLTVEEFAAVYGLGRQTAYALVRRYVSSGGREGMPREQHGKQYRISRCEVERRLGGPITWPIPGYHSDPTPPAPAPEPDTQSARRTRGKRKPDDPAQPRLFIA